MSSRYRLDSDDAGFFEGLFEQEEGCPHCGYDGPLELKRKGYRCPDCREIIIPNE